MKLLLHRNIFFCVLLLLAASCNVTKHLPAGERLYTGASVKVHVEDGNKGAGALSTELEELVRPRPNKRLLGVRYKLIFNNILGVPKGKGLRKIIRDKLGEDPVLASSVNLEKNRQVLENRLQNKGYFHATVKGDTVINDRKRMASLKFEAYTGPQYRIRSITFPKDTVAQIDKQIARSQKRSLIKVGDPYDLETIKAERNRIDLNLKNHGYYYFNADYLLMRTDSTVGKHEVDMILTLKRSAPNNDCQPYIINNIWVYPTYTIETDSMLGAAPSEKYLDYNIIDPEHKFKPKTFSRMLVFHPGEVYSREQHNRSLNRLVNLGCFKFVKARFEEVDTAGYFLDPYYFLTPLPRKSWRAEVTGLTRSNNATGGEVSLNWRNRNFFHGAELFTVGVFGGAETQVSGDVNSNILRFGTELNLFFPRIIAPFRLNTNGDFVSKTNIKLRYEFYNRSDQYTLNNYQASYGFIWKENIRKEHQLNIVNVSYVNPINITKEFQRALDTDITLRRSIEPQFIVGPSYNFNFNTLARANKLRNNWFFNGNVDIAGNLLGLATGTTFNKEKEGNGKFLGTQFAQYARFEADARHYLRLNEKNTTMLASRLYAGIGIPYGNSQNLPFIKAFFAGGANDIRAFRARSLGPGTYYVRDSVNLNGIIPDQPGDIKLEVNTELRAKLISVISGAAFIDAGNIWTLKKDPDRAGTMFTNQFLNQFAVGAGLGIRVDISFLVIRLDLAMPIRKPYLPGGPDWVFDQIDFGSSSWRRENLVVNLAIGYPF